QWVSGTHSRSTIHGFFGLGAEQTHKEAHTFDADHPEQLVGTDVGPSPAEYLLHALASCITAGIGNIAAARGIELSRVESTVTGDIDLVGLLGIDGSVRSGYQSIDVRVVIEGRGRGGRPPQGGRAFRRTIRRLRHAHQRYPGVAHGGCGRMSRIGEWPGSCPATPGQERR